MVYIFETTPVCLECGDRLLLGGDPPSEWDESEEEFHSVVCPKGPYELLPSDEPLFCLYCGGFLENPLTSIGLTNVADSIVAALHRQSYNTVPIVVLYPFYRPLLGPLIRPRCGPIEREALDSTLKESSYRAN